MKLILVGRSGSGKTSVIESLHGASPLPSKTQIHEISRLSSPVTVSETLGFFTKAHDLPTCVMKLCDSVRSFAPGPDVFGLVIQIGRFTQEERKMIEIFRETFGEQVFQFTILIFTRLDNLLYHNVSLDEFLGDSTPELKEILSLSGKRYIGFDNTGSPEAKTVYAQSLVSMMKMMQMKNNKVYTDDLLEKAATVQKKKKEEELRCKEETHRQMKEEMKAIIRLELQEQMRKDIVEKFEEEQECKLKTHIFQNDKKQRQHQGDIMKLILVGRSGSGKTSVIKSLHGSSPLPSKTQTHEISRLSSPVTVSESIGFFTKAHDVPTCVMKLCDSVRSFAPGPDVFGLVIQIGRFTQEERKMIEIFRETFGEQVFQFTILIFTRLDNLLYHNVSLDEFLGDSTPELKEILSLSGKRYIGFDNTGSPEAKTVYAQSLVSMMKTMQMKNNKVYTDDLLEKATAIQKKKNEEKLRCKEETHRQMKEEMKATIRLELQEQRRKDIVEKFEEEQESKLKTHIFQNDKKQPQHQDTALPENKEQGLKAKPKQVKRGRTSSGFTSYLSDNDSPPTTPTKERTESQLSGIWRLKEAVLGMIFGRRKF